MSSNANGLSANWRKATYSNGSASCVEAGITPGAVLIRDTKNQGNGPVLRVTPADWTRLLKSVKG